MHILPVVVGRHAPLRRDAGRVGLELVKFKTFSNGALDVTYRPALHLPQEVGLRITPGLEPLLVDADLQIVAGRAGGRRSYQQGDTVPKEGQRHQIGGRAFSVGRDHPCVGAMRIAFTAVRWSLAGWPRSGFCEGINGSRRAHCPSARL